VTDDRSQAGNCAVKLALPNLPSKPNQPGMSTTAAAHKYRLKQCNLTTLYNYQSVRRRHAVQTAGTDGCEINWYCY